MWFDTHINLHNERFDDDRAEVLTRARARGVTDMIEICQDAANFPRVLSIAEEHDLWATVGTHPHDAKEATATADNLVDMAQHPRVVGIGETGLDFHYNYSNEAAQRRNFEAHIQACQTTQLPLVIHSRNADDMMADMLTAHHREAAFPLLLHCFTAGPDLATTVLDLGGYISFSGILTFKNADDVRKVAVTIPEDRILIETDCPYLTPVPHRGERCEPWHVGLVGEYLAQLRGWSVEDCAALTSANAYACFPKAVR